MNFDEQYKELICQKCGQDYPVWFCSNELWNQIVENNEHFLCLTCFASTAEARGLKPKAWFLSVKGN